MIILNDWDDFAKQVKLLTDENKYLRQCVEEQNEEIDFLRKQWNIYSFLVNRKDEVIDALNETIRELKRGVGEH